MKIQKPSMSLSHLAKERLLEYIESEKYNLTTNFL